MVMSGGYEARSRLYWTSWTTVTTDARRMNRSDAHLKKKEEPRILTKPPRTGKR
jgi:hypothetical protein